MYVVHYFENKRKKSNIYIYIHTKIIKLCLFEIVKIGREYQCWIIIIILKQ